MFRTHVAVFYDGVFLITRDIYTDFLLNASPSYDFCRDFSVGHSMITEEKRVSDFHEGVIDLAIEEFRDTLPFKMFEETGVVNCLKGTAVAVRIGDDVRIIPENEPSFGCNPYSLPWLIRT